jgi:hypothetical protein
VSEPRLCSICGKPAPVDGWHFLGPEDTIRHLAANPDKSEAEIWQASRPSRNFSSPEEVRQLRALLDSLRPDPWIAPLYQRARDALLSEGKRPTDARIAERMSLDDGERKWTDRDVRQWRHDGLLP